MGTRGKGHQPLIPSGTRCKSGAADCKPEAASPPRKVSLDTGCRLHARLDFCTLPTRLLRTTLFLCAGILLVLATSIDVIWTSLGTHGGGPISGQYTKLLWRICLRLHNYKHDKALSFAGSLIIILLLMLWVGMLWAGWFCIFSSSPRAIVDSQTKQPAPPFARLYFTAYTLSTMGNGDYQPSSDLWRVLVALATIGGLGTFTITITFMVNVLNAVVEKRRLASYLSDIGGTPGRIIGLSWTGVQFDHLSEHLVEVTGLLHTYTEHHLAYPVLHYFHSETERTSTTLRVAALSELMLLVGNGVREEAQMPPMVIQPLQNALHGFAEVIAHDFVEPDKEPPPPPSLDLLRGYGIPTVTDEAFLFACEQMKFRRCAFKALMRDDGRNWDRVYGG